MRYGRQEHLQTRALSTALRLAAIRPEQLLIDLATGTGGLLRALADLPARPQLAIGIDHSKEMLRRVGALPDGWRVIEADARAVPLPDGFADVVTCSYLLHLQTAADRAAVLSQARRLLRDAPASRLVVVTVWADLNRPGGWLMHHLLAAMARIRPAAWRGLSPCDPTDDLHRAGFIVTGRTQLPRGGYPSLVLCARLSQHCRAGDWGQADRLAPAPPHCAHGVRGV